MLLEISLSPEYDQSCRLVNLNHLVTVGLEVCTAICNQNIQFL